MSDIRLQEIVTRAVVGRGDRRVVWSYEAPLAGADHVLGVHVGRVELSVEDEGNEPIIRVSAECDLWLSSGDETRVHRLTITQSEPVRVRLYARVVGETDTTASFARGVRCLQADIQDGELRMTLETEVAVEVTGLARFWIKAYDLFDDLSDGAETDDSLSSSDSSSSTVSDEYLTEQSSVSGTVGEVTGDLDELATLATVEPVGVSEPQHLSAGRFRPELEHHAAGDMRPHSEHVLVGTRRPVRQPGVPRQSLVCHFEQQVFGPSHVSVVQGH